MSRYTKNYPYTRSYTDRYGNPRSDAWYADGGANDEGYDYRYCGCCGKTCEHELGECITCGARNRR